MNGARAAATPWLQPAQFAVAFALLLMLPVVLWQLAMQFGWLRVDAADATVAGMIAYMLGAAAVLLFARRSPPAVPWRPLRAAAVVDTYVPFALAWFALLIGYLRTMAALGHPVVPQAQLQFVAASATTTPGFWLVVLGTVVAAPLAEELVFRGYLLGALQLVLPGWAALVATAVIFGYVHTLPCMLPIAVLGLFLGWLRQRHGSLWPSVLAHALHNAVVVLITVLWPASLPWLYPQ